MAPWCNARFLLVRRSLCCFWLRVLPEAPHGCCWLPRRGFDSDVEFSFAGVHRDHHCHAAAPLVFGAPHFGALRSRKSAGNFPKSTSASRLRPERQPFSPAKPHNVQEKT